jgi:hypothetical protein
MFGLILGGFDGHSMKDGADVVRSVFNSANMAVEVHEIGASSPAISPGPVSLNCNTRQ